MDASPFARLSPELRNSVWEYAVTSPTLLIIATKAKATTFQPAITHTCKQIRDKTVLMYYNTNAFEATINFTFVYADGGTPNYATRSLSELNRWMMDTSTDQHCAISSLCIRFCGAVRTVAAHELDIKSLAASLMRTRYQTLVLKIIVLLSRAAERHNRRVGLSSAYHVLREMLNGFGLGLEVIEVDRNE